MDAEKYQSVGKGFKKVEKEMKNLALSDKGQWFDRGLIFRIEKIALIYIIKFLKVATEIILQQ